MRLIDADALIEAIKNMSQRYCDCKDCDGRGQIIRVSEVIDIAKNEVPTAYDIDKVVEELENNSFITVKQEEVQTKRKDIQSYIAVEKEVVLLKDAIEIVKQGGVSDDVCEWKLDSHLENDTPAEWIICPHKPKRIFSKDIKYCPYCGKKINVVEPWRD